MEKQESSTERILNVFIKYSTRDIDDSSMKKLIKVLGKEEEVCKNYSVISKTIYNLSEQNFVNLKIFFGIENDKDHFSMFLDSPSLENEVKDNLQHFWRHVALSCYQRQYIESITKDVKKDVDKFGTEVEEARKKVTKIYSEFVGILGVFTALSFALMGSVQVFGNILNNINNPTIGNVGYVLIVGGIYLILIYLVIMTLFIGMGKVFNKDSKYQFDKCFTRCIILVSVVLIAAGLFSVWVG